MDKCPFERDKVVCGQPRYFPRGVSSRASSPLKPQAQMVTLPIMATIRALFANAETSQLLRSRDACLQQALHCLGTATQNTFSDFPNSSVHIHHHQHLNLFQDHRDIGFALSTDGAQLTMKKQSDTWILIMILLNFPPEIRYRVGSTIIPLATPGPKPPGNIESFLYPVFQEAAKASEGIWMWDAIDSSHFVHRAWFCMGLGDMLGSAKLSGMAGHTALKGDRFSTVQAAKSSLKPGSKALYYPMCPPENALYNPTRPSQYDLGCLPLRTEDQYWRTIDLLQNARNKAARAAIVRESGVSRLPLCAASKTFLHPTFFPLDPFHLLYENCMAFTWDLWTSLSKESDPVHIPNAKIQSFGRHVVNAMSTLPPSFSGPVRDPNLKRQSQYKVYEWMALLHWYIIPIGTELGFPSLLIENFAEFADIVEYAMTIKPRTPQDLAHFHRRITEFLIHKFFRYGLDSN